jgi:hypothetical protein
MGSKQLEPSGDISALEKGACSRSVSNQCQPATARQGCKTVTNLFILFRFHKFRINVQAEKKQWSLEHEASAKRSLHAGNTETRSQKQGQQEQESQHKQTQTTGTAPVVIHNLNIEMWICQA